MPPDFCPLQWPRAFILMDMNAFFASVEQLDFPALRARPVAVTNGLKGTCIITSSYEARQYGVKTGMHIKDGRRLCHELIQRSARPSRYAAISAAIMAALDAVTPEIEVFSVDEAFLDVTDCQALGTPVALAAKTRRIVFETSGLLCSIGVSGDKTTAKYGAKLHKPNGFTVIPPWEACKRLSTVPVTELCGIKQGIGNYLAARGVHTCGDMERLPISELARRFGNPGRRIWLMAQGLDPDSIHKDVPPPKQVSAGKVTPPATRDRRLLAAFLQHMAELVAYRLRHNRFQAKNYWVGLLADGGWIEAQYQSAVPTDDGATLNRFCVDHLTHHWRGQGIHQVMLNARDPQPINQQPDLFTSLPEKRQWLNAAMDRINEKYGQFTLMPAKLLNRSSMPDVISPAWKPTGHRRTI